MMMEDELDEVPCITRVHFEDAMRTARRSVSVSPDVYRRGRGLGMGEKEAGKKEACMAERPSVYVDQCF